MDHFVDSSSVLITGGCRGADYMTEKYANTHNIKIIIYNANWSKYGRSAGPIRNSQMMEQNPDLIIAFHSNLPQSKGTIDTIKKALSKNIPVWLVIDKEHASWITSLT